jgi:hypothetical protein
MSNCFGDGQCSEGENGIWRTAKKEKGKEVANHKSLKEVIITDYRNYLLIIVKICQTFRMKHRKKNGKRRFHKDTDYYTQPKKLKPFIKDLSVYNRR